ncbi:hypothetical protein MPER_01693 [Moniliophthora perniciosa FA553]|nr:hypothetical protein MPER_01693 [Moniliophthora perniciosa FA553]
MGVSPTEAVRFLAVAPKLKTCVLGLCNWNSGDDLDPEDGGPREIVKHDTLRVLKVYDRADLLGSLLDLITLPKLASLTVSGLVQTGGWPDAQLRNFLERSDCALQVLNEIVEGFTVTQDGADAETVVGVFDVGRCDNINASGAQFAYLDVYH